jgi:hypothetical protein
MRRETKYFNSTLVLLGGGDAVSGIFKTSADRNNGRKRLFLIKSLFG